MEQLLPAGRAGPPIGALLALAFIALEFLYGRWRDRDSYDLRETGATLVIVLGNQLTRWATAGLAAVPLLWAWDRRLLDIPMNQPLAWAILFLAVEFTYYWHHRAMHRVRFLWATHGVHHSASRLNLTAGLRLGWGSQVSGGFVFYLPLAFIGFHPLAIVAVLGSGLAYQFFLHTEHAPRLGTLEWVLNTPAHHRVHHASNDSCLDRNFGGVLIVFDRMFGTFAAAPRHEALRYGLKNAAVPANRPLAIVAAGWIAIARGLKDARSVKGIGAAMFGPP